MYGYEDEKTAEQVDRYTYNHAQGIYQTREISLRKHHSAFVQWLIQNNHERLSGSPPFHEHRKMQHEIVGQRKTIEELEADLSKANARIENFEVAENSTLVSLQNMVDKLNELEALVAAKDEFNKQLGKSHDRIQSLAAEKDEKLKRALDSLQDANNSSISLIDKDSIAFITSFIIASAILIGSIIIGVAIDRQAGKENQGNLCTNSSVLDGPPKYEPSGTDSDWQGYQHNGVFQHGADGRSQSDLYWEYQRKWEANEERN